MDSKRALTGYAYPLEITCGDDVKDVTITGVQGLGAVVSGQLLWLPYECTLTWSTGVPVPVAATATTGRGTATGKSSRTAQAKPTPSDPPEKVWTRREASIAPDGTSADTLHGLVARQVTTIYAQPPACRYRLMPTAVRQWRLPAANDSKQRWLVHPGEMTGDLWHIALAAHLDRNLKPVIVWNRANTVDDRQATAL